MDAQALVIDFELRTAMSAPLRVRLRQSGERWAADVVGDAIGFGIGTTARRALAAALEPLGAAAARRLLADIGLLEPSLRLVELEVATAS